MQLRRMAALVLLVAAPATGLRAQAGGSDTLPAASRDSVLDAALFDAVLSHTLMGIGTFYLSPYRVLQRPTSDSGEPPRHDPAWLRRAVVAHHFAAICAPFGAQRCPPHNGRIYALLSAPELDATGLVTVRTRVESVWSSDTPRHAWEASEVSIILTHRTGRWEVYCHGIGMHEAGTLTDSTAAH